MKKILTLILIFGLLVGCASQVKLKPGDYVGTAEGYGGEVSVLLTVDEDGKLSKGDVTAIKETPQIGGQAAPKMVEKIIKAQRLDVELESGATITSTAVVDAARIALKEAGADLSKFEKAAEKQKDVVIETDIVVIGAGASGTTAALAAIENGAKVVMLERTNGIGGVSKLWAGGPFAIETDHQKEAGYNLKKEDALQTMIDYSHYISYAPLQKAIIFRSADTIKWLEKYGVYFHANPETPQIAHQDDPMKWQNYHWYEQFGKDIASLDILHEQLKEKGLDLHLNTTAEKLILDDQGAVIGVEAVRKDGSKVTVKAKSVVIGTGGFGNNKEMMEENFHTPYIVGMGENYGDGAKMAWEAGAARWDIQSALLHGAGIMNGENPGKIALGASPLNQILRSPLLWIDQSGNRFANEEAVYDTAYTSNVGYSVGGRYYILVDTATLQAYSEGRHLVMDPAVGGANMDAADFVELAKEGVSQGNIISGDSITDLAKKLGMEESRLEQNIKEYNEAVSTKNDPYGKKSENLVYGIESGPYYAIKMEITNLGTTGGVRVNERLQATDLDLKPIKGLYVVGNDAGGYYGNVTAYPPYEGLATGFALNSGRIGGESAAKDALSE